MSNQNQFDQYKQKMLEIWDLVLTACGRFWDKVKVYSRKAADYLRPYLKTLRQKLAAFGKAAAAWLKKAWKTLRLYGKRLLQILAGWLLLAKEKTGPVIEKAKAWLISAFGKAKAWGASIAEKAKVWFGSVKARLPKRAAYEADNALPDAREISTEAEIAETAEAIAEQVPAEAAPRNLPDWLNKPWILKTLAVLGAIGTGIKFVFKWLCKLYKLILAVPVLWYAIKFARENMERLPEQVGLDIQSTGEFARMISRQQAVYWPLGITVFCLLLMVCSKKPILPWIISIFTLVLPWLIWALNYYA